MADSDFSSTLSNGSLDDSAIFGPAKAPRSKDDDESTVMLDLAAHVREKYNESRDTYQPEYRNMLQCIRLMRGFPLTTPDGSDDYEDVISWPIVPSIVTALNASLRDVFGTAIGAPFTCSPTTEPTLPQNVKDWLQRRLQENIPLLMQVTGGDPGKVDDAIDQLHGVVKEQMDERAADTASNLDRAVKDKLQEGHFREAFEDFLWNYVVYPVGVIKGPVMRGEKVRKWDEDTGMLSFNESEVWAVENISPFCFYPSPNARDCQSCEYVIEARRTTPLDLALLAEVGSYKPEAILEVQETYPEGYTEQFWTGNTEEPDRDTLQFAAPQTVDRTGCYDVLCFYGRVPGSLINQFDETAGLNDYEWYEAEVETIGDIVIRAELNYQPDGRRPFYSLSFEPIAGSIFGESVCTRLFDIQRACEATVRDMMWNMSLASGVGGEVDVSRLDENAQWDSFAPNEIKPVKPALQGNAGTAYNFHQVPNVAEQLQNILEKFEEKAYDIIGFSKVSLGGEAGNLGRTSSGMSIALNQSAKPLKLKTGDLGSKIIVPLVQKYIDLLLLTSDDETIKGDARVYPKGIDGLVDDETLSNNILQAMQTLGPVAQAMQAGSPMAPVLLSMYMQWAKLNSIPVYGLKNYALQQAFGQSTGSAYQGGGADGGQGQMNQPAPPMPGMDGRQQPALNSVQANNNLPATTARGPGG